MGLKVFDNVLRLGVGNDILEANKVVVLTSVRRTDNRQKIVTLGLVLSFVTW